MWSYRIYGKGGNSGGNNNNSGDNYNKLGTEVTVEALTTIDKGDRIVGIKNDEHVTPTLVSSGAGKGISTLSADGSVGISEISNITVGSKILIHFLNENGTYDTFTLSIDEVPSGITNLGQTPIINEDGTLAISSYDAALVIKIDKKNKTATYSVVRISFSNLPTDTSGVVGNMYRAEINKGNAVLVGNHLLCNPKVDTIVVSSNSFRRYRNPFAILKFNDDSFELVAHTKIEGADAHYSTFSMAGSNAILLNDKDTIVTFIRDNSYYRSKMVTYKISSKTMTISGELGTFKTMYFSKNGEYLSIKPVSGNTVIKRFNQADLTYVNVGTAMSGNIDCYPSDDGTLALSTSGVFSVETGAKLYGGGCTPANTCFNPKRWVSRVTSGNSTVFSIAPSTNAEYLIRVNDSYTTEDDKMYGVASENLTVGASGKAQMLFETKNSLDGLGKEVTVEALTVIDKGDKIVGIKNDEHVTPTLSSSSIGVSMSALSTDESVGISNTTIQVGANVLIYFKNDTGTYDVFELEITDMGSIASSFSSSFVVSDDGSLAMTSSGKNVLVININKRTKTASYSIIAIDVSGLLTSNASIVGEITGVTVNFTNANIVGNYLICSSKVKTTSKIDGNTIANGHPIATIYEYKENSFDLLYYSTISTGTNTTYYDRAVIGNAVKIDNNILFATNYDSSNYGWIHKYDIANGVLSGEVSLPRYASGIYFSKNGNYVIFNSVSGSESVLYRVNLDAFSITTVKSLGIKCNDGNFCYPNNDGTLFFRTSNGVYDVQSLTKKYNGTAVPINKFFDNKRWVTSGTAYSISPSTEAEYLISTVSEYTTEPDKMYGVANESLTVGMVGTAREITNTYSATEVTITPSTNDQVQEGLFDKVTVAGDADLIPENIKEDVEIFGVKGSMTGPWDTTQIRRCYYMFDNNTEIVDAPYFDTSGAINMGYMFNGCNNLKTVPQYNTGNVTTMIAMFNSCGNLEEVPLLDTSKVTSMKHMFSNCGKLKTVPLFDTSSVVDMNSAFSWCTSLEEIPLFDTSKATDMNGMLSGCKSLETVPQFDTSNAIYINSMFMTCTNLKTTPQFDASKVCNIQNIFSNCAELIEIGGFLNLGKAFTQKIENAQNYKLDLSYCWQLTHDSLMNVINNLYDLNLTYDVANGGTLYTQSLILGSENLAKLTAEEIAIATNKGWNVT